MTKKYKTLYICQKLMTNNTVLINGLYPDSVITISEDNINKSDGTQKVLFSV